VREERIQRRESPTDVCSSDVGRKGIEMDEIRRKTRTPSPSTSVSSRPYTTIEQIGSAQKFLLGTGLPAHVEKNAKCFLFIWNLRLFILFSIEF
jgi:hypothetical protein